jgi:hypothetical protein
VHHLLYSGEANKQECIILFPGLGGPFFDWLEPLSLLEYMADVVRMLGAPWASVFLKALRRDLSECRNPRHRQVTNCVCGFLRAFCRRDRLLLEGT